MTPSRAGWSLTIYELVAWKQGNGQNQDPIRAPGDWFPSANYTTTSTCWAKHFLEQIRIETNYCIYFIYLLFLSSPKNCSEDNSEICLRAVGKLSYWLGVCLFFFLYFQLILLIVVLNFVHRNLFVDCDPFCNWIKRSISVPLLIFNRTQFCRFW